MLSHHNLMNQLGFCLIINLQPHFHYKNQRLLAEKSQKTRGPRSTVASIGDCGSPDRGSILLEGPSSKVRFSSFIIERTLDLYNYERRVKDRTSLYQKSDDRNLQKIAEFRHELGAEGLSPARINKYMETLTQVNKKLHKKDFVSVTKQDIKNFIAEINCSGYSVWTKRDYKVITKRFWKWLKGMEDEDGYPDEVNWIKTTIKRKDKVSVRHEDILKPEEIFSMVEHCRNVRDKAMLMTLFESGMRPSELLTMQIRNVRFEEQGAYISVTGKTGDKLIFVYLAAPLLSQWLSEHPRNDNPEAYFWISLNSINYLGILSPNRLRTIVKTAARDSGITKRVWSYLLRHSAATDDSKVMTYAVLCEKYGWTPGSKMPSVYVHLAGDDLRDAQLKKYGLQAGRENFVPSLTECSRCHYKCSPGTRFCPACGLCLNQKTKAKLQEGGDRLQGNAEMAELQNDVNEIKEIIVGLLKSGQASFPSARPS